MNRHCNTFTFWNDPESGSAATILNNLRILSVYLRKITPRTKLPWVYSTQIEIHMITVSMRSKLELFGGLEIDWYIGSVLSEKSCHHWLASVSFLTMTEIKKNSNSIRHQCLELVLR